MKYSSVDIKYLTKAISLGILSVFIIFLNGCCKTHDVTDVYDVYYQAMVYPSDFDSYVQSNQDKFDDEFHKCLDKIEENVAKIVEDKYEICDQHADPDWYQQCVNEIEEGSLLLAIGSIRSVIREGKPYFDTFTGQAISLVILFWGEENYQTIQKSFIDNMKPYFTCYCTKDNLMCNCECEQ